MNQLQQQPADYGQLIKHYVDLFLRWKWYVIIVWPVITLVAAMVIIKFSNSVPVLSAKVLIGIENTEDMTAVRDVVNMVESQSDLIKSRLLLEHIVRKLSLTFSLDKKYARIEILDTISVDSLVPMGIYSLKIDKNEPGRFSLFFYRNKTGGIPIIRKFLRKPLCLYRGDFSRSSVIDLGPMHLVFTKKFRKSPHDISFKILDIREAVEGVYNSVSIKAAEAERQSSNNIEVSVAGKDYPLIASIANSIADAFIEKNVNFRKGRSQNVLSSLEKQLETVKQDLAGSEQALRNFRTANPTVGLTDNARQQVSAITQHETGVFNDKRNLGDAQDLLDRFASAGDDEKVRLAGEVLVFLQGKNNSSAPVLQSELGQLLNEQRELKRNYAPDHPLVLENRKKMDKLTGDILAALREHIGTIQSSLTNRQQEVHSLSGELQRLPSSELQLAELQRRNQVASDIYATVLSRYNQARVAGSAEMAGAYVMDYAIPPLPPPGDNNKLLGIALLLGIAIAFGPAIVSDLLDKTARTAYDFTKKTGKPIFELVPVLPPVVRQPNIVMSSSNEVPIVSKYFPNSYAHEVFRMLRTKVVMALDKDSRKILCVTSLESGEGKSTVSTNIASVLAQQDAPTLLIDADLRRGELHLTFGCKKGPGLSEFLTKSDGIPAAPIEACIQKTFIPKLSLISVGAGVKNSSELLASRQFAALINVALTRFSYVIIDAPPLGAITDAAVIAQYVSKYLVIVNSGKTNVHDLMARIAEFPSVVERIMGYVMNRSPEKRAIGYYNRSKYST